MKSAPTHTSRPTLRTLLLRRRGRNDWVVDGEGYLTETVYDTQVTCHSRLL